MTRASFCKRNGGQKDNEIDGIYSILYEYAAKQILNPIDTKRRPHLKKTFSRPYFSTAKNTVKAKRQKKDAIKSGKSALGKLR
jgi:hypothetical protein